MTPRGFNQPLYILPFDHRGSFQKKMFGLCRCDHRPLAAAAGANVFVAGSSIFGSSKGIAVAMADLRDSIAYVTRAKMAHDFVQR